MMQRGNVVEKVKSDRVTKVQKLANDEINIRKSQLDATRRDVLSK